MGFLVVCGSKNYTYPKNKIKSHPNSAKIVILNKLHNSYHKVDISSKTNRTQITNILIHIPLYRPTLIIILKKNNVIYKQILWALFS